MVNSGSTIKFPTTRVGSYIFFYMASCAVLLLAQLFLPQGIHAQAPPTLVAPGTASSPGPTIATTRPTFTWNTVSGANGYGLYVRRENDGVLVFDSEIHVGQPLTGASYVIPSGFLSSGFRYKWNMRSHSASGYGTSFSTPFYFQVTVGPLAPPTLNSPGSTSSPGPTISTTTPSFTWNTVSGANGYGLYVRRENDGVLVFDSEVHVGNPLTGSSYSIPSGFLGSGFRYKWNMRSHSASGYSTSFSNSLYFQVAAGPLAPPTLSGPGSTSSPGPTISTTTPNFSWNTVSGADGYGLYVRRENDGVLVFDSETHVGNPLTGNSYSIPSGFLGSGFRYKWNMRSHSAAGYSTSFSGSLYFQVAAGPLAPPTLSSPGSSSSPGPTIATTTPSFTWAAVTGADGYGLYVRRENDGVLIFDSETHVGSPLTGTSYTIPVGFIGNGFRYKWNMRSHNASGYGTSFSSHFYFQVAATGGVDIRVEPLSLQFSNTSLAIDALSREKSDLRFGDGNEAAAQVSVYAGDLSLVPALRRVGQGGRLKVEGLLFSGDTGTSTLELQRFEIWRPDAIVMVGDQRVPVPKTLYFRGSVVGYPDSSVLLSVREKGDVMGMVFRADGGWAIGKRSGQDDLRTRKADPTTLERSFSCGTDGLGGFLDVLEGAEVPAVKSSGTVFDQQYTATIAIETDYEYYAKFLSAPDPQAAALDYMADLMGYADLVYSREIDTDLTIGFARLWNGGAATDPWTVTTGYDPAVNELRVYWNQNLQSIKRTAVHFLSAKPLGGGAAWVGRLCENFSVPGGSLDYGISGGITADFNWDANQSNNPAAVVWDIYVVTHEIGHNFNSPHAHEYCGIGGSSQPIDRCWTGCAGAATGLPACSSSTPFFNGGAGTIMSYCHQVGGGIANIAMTFGEGHTCGTLPGRQADQMRAHVVERATAFPSCFQRPGTAFTIFNDGSGSLAVNSLALESPAPWISWTPAAPYNIPAGGSQVVTVNVNLTLAPSGQSTRRILVSSNDPDESPYPGGVHINVNRVGANACTSFSISPPGANPSAASGSQSVAITGSPSGCQGGSWSASGNGSWLTVSPTSGTGSGSVTVSWAQNTLPTSRSSSADIAGNSFNVNQSGITPTTCTSFSIDPTSANPSSASGSQSVTITGSPAECTGGSWSASGNGSWLTVSPTSGTGSGSATVSWAQNTSPSSRSSSANLATNTFTVNQAGGGGAPLPNAPADFDGDGVSDWVVYRSGTWLYLGPCIHPLNETGPALNPACSSCVATVCTADSFCCASSWDELCISEAVSLCQ